MGIYRSLVASWAGKRRLDDGAATAELAGYATPPVRRRRLAGKQRDRRCQVEPLEPRQLLAASGLATPVILGSVYFEEATGDDSRPDVIQVSFEGGAIGTTLDRMVIDGDKLGNGLTDGDVFFDTASGGLGAFKSVGLSVVGANGFSVDSVSVVDGGTQIVFTFSGFDAGEVFEFSVDVDESQFVEPGAIVGGQVVDLSGIDVNPLVEGAEFQRSIMTGKFTAPHYVDLTLSGLYWDAFDGNFSAAEAAAGATLDLPDDKYSAEHDLTDRTAGAVAYAAQIPLATISGYVYHDRSDDGNFNRSTEQGIGGVTVELLKNGSPTGITTTTSSSPGNLGYYEFLDLVPGSYGVREFQPTGWLDGKDTAGSHGGVAANESAGRVDRITGAVLDYGDDAINYNFGELLPGSIAGHVQASTGPDCDFDNPEIVLAGIQIDLVDASGTVIDTKFTDQNGRYKFTGLAPGQYTVREHQPADYFDGEERVGTAGGTASDVGNTYSVISGIQLGSGVDAVNYDFCEHVGVMLSGYVYHDRSNDGVYDRDSEQAIPGVVVKLLDGNLNDTGERATTDADGFYKFNNLPAGKYAVMEVQPVGWLDGLDTPGNLGGIADSSPPGDMIRMIMINFGQMGTDYNFGELLPGSIAGSVHVSTDADCDPNDGEPPIAGVRIDLLNDAGQVVATTFTDANGEYEFTGLRPGTYSVLEHQPADYFDGMAHVGSGGGVALTRNLIGDIAVGSDEQLVRYDFCEEPPVSIAGHVQASTGPDCDFDNPEILLSGVVVELRNGAGNLVATTTTNANGQYRFDGLRAGEYQVHELQPDGYFDGEERVGSAGGVLDGVDTIHSIILTPGVDAVNYDFCEHVGVMLSGYVYHDRSNDGVYDRDSEQAIPGVVVKLLDGNLNDTGERATTGADGFYKFNNLPAGKYAVMEVQPVGWLDGLDTPGNLGGIADSSPPGDMIRMIMINFGQMGTDYNFGELLPGSIAGSVHVSTDADCDPNDGEPPIAGVRIDLLNDAGQVVATTFTDANGEYELTGLRPGTYSVLEHQPADYFDGMAHVGSGGGVALTRNLIGDIAVGSDEQLVRYDFCEEPPAELSGYVFIDGLPIVTDVPLTPEQVAALRDGTRTPDDEPLAGVVLELRDGTTGEPIAGDIGLPGHYPAGPIRTVTDANGFYRFAGLRAGTYAVIEIGPEGLIDGVDTPGSLGGFAVNPNGVPVGRRFDPTGAPIVPSLSEQSTIELFRLQFGTDAIVRIRLPASANSVENNFSEVRTRLPPPLVPPLDTPPPRPVPPPIVTPPLPFVARLAVPPLRPIDKPDDVFGGSSKALGFTWHLSVVNGGQPRSVQAGTSRFALASTAIDAAAWHDLPMDSARWTLATVAGQTVTILRDEMFGHPDGRPVTGDFNGDGVTDIAVFVDGKWFIDFDGNGRWNDGDLWAKLGSESDLPVVGDWDDDGKSDIGIFGPAWSRDPWAIAHEPGLPDSDNYPTQPADKAKNLPPLISEATSGGRVLKRTANGRPRADVIDHVFHYGVAGDVPVAGDWNGDGIRAIGLFRDGRWNLDLNGDGRYTDADAAPQFGQAGDLPVVGDFNGDGIDEIGVYRDGQWIVDTNGNRQIDAYDQVFELGGYGDLPVVGDWDGDGIDDPGTYQPAEVADRVSRRAG